MVDRSLTSPHPHTTSTHGPGTSAASARSVADPAALEEQVANLQRALHNSRQIGAATGILMARHGWPYEQAFEWLRRVSQTSNRKVSDLAEEIVLTGTVEPTRGAGRSSGSPRPRLSDLS